MNPVLPVLALLILLGFSLASHAHGDWAVVLPETCANEEAVRVAIADLNDAAKEHGIAFNTVSENAPLRGDAIIVGASDRNAVTHRLAEENALSFEGVKNPEGYEIATIHGKAGRTIVVAGGSVLGDAYGLYWIRDRLCVSGGVPDINVKRQPALELRYTRIVVRNKDDIRRALRYGLNTVYGENPLRLIPWNVEPEDTENEACRAAARKLAAYAHSMHLRFLAFGTDFTYHPALLKELGATLSPSDPKFWQAVQEKYRRLFRAMPELDGVCTFTADEQQFWGNYQTFDVMHGGDDCDWNLAKRYRTFVTKMWEVVAGEFDKVLFNRTWATNMYEQQAQPEVYRSIFTGDVPTKNLYLIPSFTQNDRWWFQAYNPTINQTPHNTMVVCETMDYHAGGAIFPTYPGAYFQAGLQTMLDAPQSNLKGLSLDMPAADDWQTRTLTAYTVSRLAWDHHDDVHAIARDFAAMHFGPAAAEGMAELLLMSPVAYKYGLYIEPAAYGEFNSLPHIRVGQFVAQGYTRIDGGREHIEFLRGLYLRCKPWLPEALMYLDHGLATAETMCDKYAHVCGQVSDPALAEDLGNALGLTRLLIATNNWYVKTMFAYFQYSDEPSEERRKDLAAAHENLTRARNEFANAPGFEYQLFGVDQLLLNAAQALDNLEEAERRLADAPSSQEIEKAVVEEQAAYAELLTAHQNDAVKILHWRGKIDGRDILRMRGSDVSIEHLRWDPPSVEISDVPAPLPGQIGTVVPRSTQSRPLHPFVLEQPCEENGFTVEVYMNDLPGGAGWWEFDLYFIPQSPAELGVRPSLRTREKHGAS